MNEIAKIAAGVAIGLTVFCGGGLLLTGVMCNQAAANVARQAREKAEGERSLRERFGKAPEVGSDGLAIPVARFMEKEWNYVPKPAEVQAKAPFLDRERGWVQFVIFDHDDKITGWVFKITGWRVVAEEIKPSRK